MLRIYVEDFNGFWPPELITNISSFSTFDTS
jgi:hypothetical protein